MAVSSLLAKKKFNFEREILLMIHYQRYYAVANLR